MISIVIPVFNNTHHLKKCLQSISQQTVIADLEIIIVNDGSPEQFSAPVIKGLENKIKYFKIGHSGAAAARNFGFKKSAGDSVFFCDSDVVFLKNNALELMQQKLQDNPAKAYVYCGFKFGFKTMPSFDFDENKLKQMNYISTMSLVRRSALEKLSSLNLPFDESLKRFQDWDLWLSLLKIGETGVRIPKILWQAKTDGTISSWLPSIFFKLPFFKKYKKLKNFEQAKKIILNKHNLT